MEEVTWNFERLMSDLGGFGRFQMVLYALLYLPCVFPAVFTLSSVFTAATPDHRCLVPDCDDAADPHYVDGARFANFTEVASCAMRPETEKYIGLCVPPHFDQESAVKCGKYVYDASLYTSTIVTEWDLTCDRAWGVAFSESIMFFGVLVSAVIFGWLADAYGRRHTLMASVVIMAGGSLGMALSPTYDAFLAFTFIGALGQLALFQTTFILAVESVGGAKRVLCGVAIEFFYVIGELLLTLIAWATHSRWRLVLAIGMLPSVAFLAYWPFLPESMRWLLSNKRQPEAQVLADRIARRNGKPTPVLDDYKEVSVSSGVVRDTLWQVIKTPVLLGRGLNVAFCWFVVSLIFYGLSMNSASLAGDPYLNFALVSLVEAPGYALCYFGMERLGRRVTVSRVAARLRRRALRRPVRGRRLARRRPLPRRQAGGDVRLRHHLPLHDGAVPDVGAHAGRRRQLHVGPRRRHRVPAHRRAGRRGGLAADGRVWRVRRAQRRARLPAAGDAGPGAARHGGGGRRHRALHHRRRRCRRLRCCRAQRGRRGGRRADGGQ